MSDSLWPARLLCHGSFQARTLDSVATSFSRGSSQLRDQTLVSCVSCISRWILYHWATWGHYSIAIYNYVLSFISEITYTYIKYTYLKTGRKYVKYIGPFPKVTCTTNCCFLLCIVLYHCNSVQWILLLFKSINK